MTVNATRYSNSETDAIAFLVEEDKAWSEAVRTAIREAIHEEVGAHSPSDITDEDAGEIVQGKVLELLRQAVHPHAAFMASNNWLILWSEIGAKFLADVQDEDTMPCGCSEGMCYCERQA